MRQTLAHSDINHSVITLDQGMELFAQGNNAHCFYIVLSGSVDIYRDKEMVMQLGPESVLGAEPLFSPKGSYLYTAKSSDRVRLSRYSYPELLDILGTQPVVLKQMLNSIFGQLTDFWTETYARQGNITAHHFSGDIRSYQSNQWVIREGEYDTEIFRIVSTDKGLEVSKEGHTLTVLHNQGEFFGEMAAILNEKRSASVRSVGNSILEVYPGNHLQKIFTDYPQVSMRIISNLSQRLAETTRALVDREQSP